MDPRTFLARGVSTGLRLGRGTADRMVSLTSPHLSRLAERVVTTVRRPERPTPATFTPSRVVEPTPEEPASSPSPAVVARNIGPQRPSARPARSVKPPSGPGAKLPPPRPTTS